MNDSLSKLGFALVMSFCLFAVGCSSSSPEADDEATEDGGQDPGTDEGSDTGTEGDDDTSTGSDASSDTEDDIPSTCGNGVEDGLEGCDGDSVSCTTFGTGFTGGEAPCRSDCLTYDVTDCTTDIPPYAVVSGSFSTPFVLDDSRLGDNLYVAAHGDGIVAAAPFTGSFATGTPIPNPAGSKTVAYALRSTARDWLYVIQETMAQEDGETVYHGPHFELHWAYPEIHTGPYSPAMLIMGATRLYMWDYDPTGTTRCMSGIGFGGTIEVTAAEGVAAPDGGSLSFEVQDVKIYHPEHSPLGEALQFDNVEICPL